MLGAPLNTTSMKHLPPQPGPRAGLRERFDFLQAMAGFLGTQVVALRKAQRITMATVKELQDALDAQTTATAAASAAQAAASAAISAEIAQLKAALDELKAGDTVTQERIDQLNASTAAIEAATAQDVSDTAALVADDEPAA